MQQRLQKPLKTVLGTLVFLKIVEHFSRFTVHVVGYCIG
jgi:hypothetical protein